MTARVWQSHRSTIAVQSGVEVRLARGLLSMAKTVSFGDVRKLIKVGPHPEI
jgi:hypothetical protein